MPGKFHLLWFQGMGLSAAGHTTLWAASNARGGGGGGGGGQLLHETPENNLLEEEIPKG